MNYININFNFHENVVLVVGGSRGIGESVVHAFINAGAQVIYASRNAIKNIGKDVKVKTDEGDIIIQKQYFIQENDTPETLKKEIQKLEQDCIIECVKILSRPIDSFFDIKEPHK